jgi:hypothetical protein
MELVSYEMEEERIVFRFPAGVILTGSGPALGPTQLPVQRVITEVLSSRINYLELESK